MYTLNVNFSNEDLTNVLSQGLKLVIAKPEDQREPNIAWHIFTPLQTNTITWNEEYGIYISESTLRIGSHIPQFAKTPLGTAPNKVYVAERNGHISGPQGDVPGPFTLVNNNTIQQDMAAGLYQAITVNGSDCGGKIVSVDKCYPFMETVMYPGSKVYLWLQSNIEQNRVILPNMSALTQFQFGNGVEKITVRYDQSSGKFVPAAS